MREEDANKEGYKDLDEFRNVWIKINGWWSGSAIVCVIEFELISENIGEKKNAK